MNWRTIAGGFALALALLAPMSVPAQDEERQGVPEDALTAVGPIEKIDRDGRIWVDGQPYVVTDRTEIFDQVRRKADRIELTAGVPVELIYENTMRGSTALQIYATLMR